MADSKDEKGHPKNVNDEKKYFKWKGRKIP